MDRQRSRTQLQTGGCDRTLLQVHFLPVPDQVRVPLDAPLPLDLLERRLPVPSHPVGLSKQSLMYQTFTYLIYHSQTPSSPFILLTLLQPQLVRPWTKNV